MTTHRSYDLAPGSDGLGANTQGPIIKLIKPGHRWWNQTLAFSCHGVWNGARVYLAVSYDDPPTVQTDVRTWLILNPDGFESDVTGDGEDENGFTASATNEGTTYTETTTPGLVRNIAIRAPYIRAYTKGGDASTSLRVSLY